MRKLVSKICMIWLFIILGIGHSFFVNAEEQGTGVVSGVVSGIQEEDMNFARVVLYNSTNSYQVGISQGGAYEITGVKEDSYYLKIEVSGYKIPSPKAVIVSEGETLSENLEVTLVEGSNYYYQWKADDTYFGYEESATVPERKKVTFLDEEIYVPDSNAANKLQKKYNLYLSNEDVDWSSDYSSRMLELLNEIPNLDYAKASKWILTKDYIDNDILVTYGEESDTVLISESAFTNAIPKKASLNGLKGTFFSNRLYQALIRYVTKEGTDIDFIDGIFKSKFGCSIKIPDYEELTKGITNETAAAFEEFKPEELLAMLNMFQEMPSGFHKVDGLDYLVRRVDGQRHPIYPQAAAVSWVNATPGYIEFMDNAFLASEVEDTFRLILHEKCHFLWKHVFSSELKSAWEKVGGWYESENDTDGWATTKQTEFVTQYAHAHNPDEDMAESIAYYILLPDKLESRSVDKYNFIKNYIMNGEIYMSQIREELTFEVYNLYPDYAYPGRIVGLDIDIKGEAKEDKEVTVTVTLDTNGDERNGATKGFLRMTSRADTFKDLWLSPIDEDYSVLQGKTTFSKFACDGFWYCDQITLTDMNENQRFEGVDDFGWKMYMNNALADLEKPEYIEDTLRVETSLGEIDGEEVTYVDIFMDVKDNIGVKHTYCEIANNTHNSYRMDQWSEEVDEIHKNEITTMRIRYVFTKYFQSGEYSINYLKVIDLAGNEKKYNFLEIVHFVVDDRTLSEENQAYTISSDSDELTVNEKMQMSFSEADDEKEYIWECIGGTGVALIDQKGVLTGVSPGTVTVLVREKEAADQYGVKIITIKEAVPTATPTATPVVTATASATTTSAVTVSATPTAVSTATPAPETLLTQNCNTMTKTGSYTGEISTPFSGLALCGNGDGCSSSYTFLGTNKLYRIIVKGASSNSSAASVSVYVGETKRGSVSFTGTSLQSQSVDFKLLEETGNLDIKFLLETDNGSNDTYLNCFDLICLGDLLEPPAAPVPSGGAAYTGTYRNMFKEAGYSEAEITEKVNNTWQKLFYGSEDERIFYPVGDDMAYIYTADTNDVRSEGMFYGMMICVQMDKQEEFNKLWKWAKTYMQHTQGEFKGYFATALLFASARWGDGQGIFDYNAEAQELLNNMYCHDNGSVTVNSLFNATHKMPVFCPVGSAMNYTDPSYHLPAFYEVWALCAEEHNDFWSEAAEASRQHFEDTTNETTGLGPDYSEYDGTPTGGNHADFRFDAWRIASNIACDFAWWGKDSWATTHADRIQSFFTGKGVEEYGNQWTLDGTQLDSDHSPGLVAMNSVASLAASKQVTWQFLEDFWNISPTTGKYRYYDGCLYMMGLLHCSGNFRVYLPNGITAAPSSTITPTTATFDKEETKQEDVSVTMNLNDNELSQIKNGSTVLAEGSDYTVNGTEVVISKSYLSTLQTRSTTLTFVFSAGRNAKLVLTIKDTTEGVVEDPSGPFEQISAAAFSDSNDVTVADGVVTFNSKDSWIAFDLDFGTNSVKNAVVSVKEPSYGAQVFVYMDELSNQVGTIYNCGNGSWTETSNNCSITSGTLRRNRKLGGLAL